jgi:asparagine synthetase B (glutamine-hydrolysing)
MSIFFAVFGQQGSLALRHACKAFDSSSEKSRSLSDSKTHQAKHWIYKPAFENENCVLGYLDFNKASAAHEPTKNDALQAPIMLQTRLRKSAFFACNSSSFNTLNELHASLSKAPVKTLSQMQGDFTLAQVNDSGKKLQLAVSPYNPQTLFYAKLPNFDNTFVISSSITVLLALVKGEACRLALASWLAGRPDPNRSMYKNIYQVPQASRVLLSINGEVKTEVFWDLGRVANSYQNSSHEALTDKLTQLLKNSVKLNVQSECLKVAPEDKLSTTNKTVFTQLSGGMDSTSVSALAYTTMDAPKLNLHSISHTYRRTESCNEIDNINEMLNKYSFAQAHFIELDKYTDYTFDQLYPTHAQSPGMVMSPKYYEEAAILKSNNAKVLLTGNGGDEMFWGHSLAYYDRVKKADISVLPEVIRGARELNLPILQTLKSVFIRPILDYDILPLLNWGNKHKAKQGMSFARPSWLTADAKQLINEAEEFINPYANSGSERAKLARYEGLRFTSTFNSMRSYQAVFDEYDLQVQHPFFTKEIAEFSFAVDQSKHISGKFPKLLLRQAMNDYLPEAVCWNTHKTVFDQHFAKLVQQNQDSIRKLISHDGLEQLGLLDTKTLLSAFDTLVKSEKPSLNVDLLYAILVQSWYQTHILGLKETA